MNQKNNNIFKSNKVKLMEEYVAGVVAGVKYTTKKWYYLLEDMWLSYDKNTDINIWMTEDEYGTLKASAYKVGNDGKTITGESQILTLK